MMFVNLTDHISASPAINLTAHHCMYTILNGSQHNDQIKRSVICSASVETKTFCSRFLALRRTHIFMVISTTWDALSGLVRTFEN